MAKMSVYVLLFSVLITVSGCVETEETDDSSETETVPCEEVCKQTFPLHTYPEPEHLDACYRGCRLFSIIDMVEEFSDVEVGRNSCRALCKDAYDVKEQRDACSVGCENQQSFFMPFQQIARQLESDFFRPEPFDTGFMYPLLYAHNFYSNMIDKLSDSMSFSWTLYTQPEDGKMVVVRSQPKYFFFSNDPDFKTQNYVETNLALNDNSATPDVKSSQQLFDFDSDKPYRLGARGLEPMDSYYDTDTPQDWLSCIANRTGLSKLLICLTLFTSCLGMIWLCLSTTATAKEQRIEVSPQRLSFYGDLEYLRELEAGGMLKKLNPQDPGVQAGPLPVKIKVQEI